MELKRSHLYFFFIGIIIGRIFDWIFIPIPKIASIGIGVNILSLTLIIVIFVLFISFIYEKMNKKNKKTIIGRFNSILFLIISIILGYGVSVVLLFS
jgi:uncharacterized membrane protein YwzB